MSLDLSVHALTASVIYYFLLIAEGLTFIPQSFEFTSTHLLIFIDATSDQAGLALFQTVSLVFNLQFGVTLRKYRNVHWLNSGSIMYTVRIFWSNWQCLNFPSTGAEVTNNLVFVQRILEYCQLKPERQPKTPIKISSDWPYIGRSQGKIEFKNVFYRYATDLEPVLRGLSFLVKPTENVCVVGRTGAGKSSLISSIFRLAEIEGDILIDDVNTSSIDLKVLRSRIAIIPQTPTLFSGTLRK